MREIAVLLGVAFLVQSATKMFASAENQGESIRPLLCQLKRNDSDLYVCVALPVLNGQ